MLACTDAMASRDARLVRIAHAAAGALLADDERAGDDQAVGDVVIDLADQRARRGRER